MQAAIKRKLNEQIEFVAGNYPGVFAAVEIRTQVLLTLDFREQQAILNAAVLDAVERWIKRRIGRGKPEQMVFPDFPHVPPLIRVGRKQAVALAYATDKELEVYFEEVKARFDDMRQHLAERLRESISGVRRQVQEEFDQMKAEYKEVLRMLKLARSHPGVPLGELMERRQPARPL